MFHLDIRCPVSIYQDVDKVPLVLFYYLLNEYCIKETIYPESVTVKQLTAKFWIGHERRQEVSSGQIDVVRLLENGVLCVFYEELRY